ncbi:hypothetical protein [Oceanisphaera sediminis]
MLHYYLLKNGFGELIQLAPVQNSAVLEKGSDLPPEARLFIIRLFVIHGASVSFSGTVKSLVKECDSDDRAVRKGMDYLKQAGLITQVRDSSGKTLYQVSGFIQQYIVSRSPAGSPPPPLHEQIYAVLFPEHGDNPERVKRGGFSRASRYLLAVMLAHSDALGMVTGVSNAELRKLTGMTEQRLRGQIKNLLDSSILCGYMPGFNGGALLGKVKSEFALGLSHVVFGACSARYGCVDYEELAVTFLNEASAVDAVYSRVRSLVLRRSPDTQSTLCFFGIKFSVDELRFVLDEKFRVYLRWVVLASSSYLINERKSLLESAVRFSLFDTPPYKSSEFHAGEVTFCNYIARRFMNVEACFDFDGMVVAALNRDSCQLTFKLASFIFRASLMLARKVSFSLSELSKERSGLCNFLIFKVGNDRSMRCFSMHFCERRGTLPLPDKYSIKVYPSNKLLDSGRRSKRKVDIFEEVGDISKLIVSVLDDVEM